MDPFLRKTFDFLKLYDIITSILKIFRGNIMATYRYFDVRRDVYEKCSNKKMRKMRYFAEMKKLFKVGYWILLIAMLVSLIICLLMLFLCNTPFLCLIPGSVIIVLSIVGEFWGGNMYNDEARKKELQEYSESLEQFIFEVQNILQKHKINTREQRNVLKEECKKQISLHSENFKSISRKVYDVFVGIPLGALISAIIYKSSADDAILLSIVFLIICGIVVISAANLIKKVAYYSEGHFKDQYLLNVLNELEYLDD